MARLNTAVSSVVLWEVPELELVEEPQPEPDFTEMELGRLDPKGWRRHPEPPPAAAPEPNPPVPGVAPEPPPNPVSLEAYAHGLAAGREAGFVEGHAAALRAAEPLIADRLQRFDAIAARLAEPIRALERPVEEAVLALALEVARRIVVGEIARSREFLVSLVREALAKVPIDVGTPKIVLHPDDVALVRSLAPDLEAHGIVLVENASIEPGGALVVADGGEGDAMKDRRWHPRAYQSICQVDLTLAARWREVMLAMFEDEEL